MSKNMFFIILALVVLAVTFSVGLEAVDPTIIFENFRSLKPVHIISAALATGFTIVLSTIRYSLILQRIGLSQNWKHTHKSNVMSQIYALVTMPLIMQIVTRITHSTGADRAFIGPVTVLEKSISFSVMVAFGAGASYLFLGQSFLADGFISAVGLIGCAVMLSGLAAVTLILSPKEVHDLKSAAVSVRRFGIISTLILSILMQLLILSSYVVLALQFLPYENILTLAAAFSFVVLATSLPVGTGGWGVREVAAGSSFALFQLPIEIGVISGFLYGVIHLITLGLNAIIVRNAETPSRTDNSVTAKLFTADYWAFGLVLIFLLIAFQIRMPLMDNRITINVVDILALMLAINFLLFSKMKHGLKPIWAHPLMWTGVAGFVAMMSIGWLVGYFYFESNSWATANRLFGMISIFSFLFCGVALRHSLPHRWLGSLSLTLSLALIISCIFQIIFSSYLSVEGREYFNWSQNLSGFVGDRNAFAFFCVISIFFLFFCHSNGYTRHIKPQLILLTFGLSGALTVICGSRTGFIALAIVAGYMFQSQKKLTLQSMALSCFVLAGFYVLTLLTDQQDVLLLGGRTSLESNFVLTQSRWDTWMVGWDLFRTSPFFGGGLGASFEMTGQVIHNLFLWVLGEMGIIGAILCLPLGWVVIHTTFLSETVDRAERWAMLIFCLIIGGFCITQDIIYQRILWLMLGFFLASRTITLRTMR